MHSVVLSRSVFRSFAREFSLSPREARKAATFLSRRLHVVHRAEAGRGVWALAADEAEGVVFLARELRGIGTLACTGIAFVEREAENDC